MTTFTNHASKRLRERTSLDRSEIKSLIHHNKVLPLGAEGKKTHFLVYSEPDDECVIVVFDTETKEVVTVYKWQYQPRRCYYNVNTEILNRAKDLVMKPVVVVTATTSIQPLNKANDKWLKKLAAKQALSDKNNREAAEQHREAHRQKKISWPKYTIWTDDYKLVSFYAEDFSTHIKSDEFKISTLPAIKGALKAKRLGRCKIYYTIKHPVAEGAVVSGADSRDKKILCQEMFEIIEADDGFWKPKPIPIMAPQPPLQTSGGTSDVLQ